MCGIFGIASGDGCGVDPDLLWFGTHRVRHRGPDDWGFVSLSPIRKSIPQCQAWKFWDAREIARDYRIGLGSRRLSILDLSAAGRQPMNLPSTDLWVVFNGEIYNFLELRAQLASDRKFMTGTDTEVLLAAYARWGTGCLTRLNGMFAFAIWDGNRRKLLLARDRWGEKPLYFLRSGNRILFASELKQFFEDKDFRRELDPTSLADFLLLSLQDHDERTFFKDVKQLLPAHWLEWNADTGEIQGPNRYWAPQIANDFDTSQDHAFVEELPSLLRDSIRLRLRSDVRVGICLSGGLDSTSICSCASSLGEGQASLTAYTMAFPGMPEDESGLASQIAKRFGVRLVRSTMDADNLWGQIQQFIYFQDGPTGGASNLASWRIFEAARADGSVVLLSGQGGDELFAGYNKFFFFWLQILASRGHWLRLMESAVPYFRKNGFSKWNYSDSRRYLPLFLRKRIMGMWQFSRPEFRMRAAERVDVGSSESLNRRLWKDLSRFSLPCLLHWEDRNSMAVSTEARIPFLDHRLVEAVLCTSAYTKLRNGYTKYSLRHAMSATLPPAVCWQKQKRGFDTPARRWFKCELSEPMTELFGRPSSLLNEFVDVKQLAQHYEAFRRGEGETLTEYDWFKLVGASVWLDQLHSSVHDTEPAMAAV